VDAGLLLVIVIALALTFDLTNGFHDSSNSLAAPVATRAMSPGQALFVTTIFTVLGPIVAGTAVADTVGGLIEVSDEDVLAVLLAALLAAVGWNLLTWRFGLPSSSSHALIGGLVGAGVASVGPSAINWGGFDNWRPTGVVGVLVVLASSPLIGGLSGWLMDASGRRALRRADRSVTSLLKAGQWVTSAALAFAHGTNDAQETMGLITLSLVSVGALSQFEVPLWVKITCAAAMTCGTALGGWRIVRTVGRGIYRIRPLDGLASQGASTLVIGVAAALGAPVSTTHIVASSVVGVGAARRKRHVHWMVVREILLAWVVTLPGCAALGAAIAWMEGLAR
jgi:PiT family inorganic phosphate transporter